jgi:hypothetical protein
MYSGATAEMAGGFVLHRMSDGVVWRGLERVGVFWAGPFDSLRALRRARWVRFAAAECIDGFGTFRDILGQWLRAGWEVWLRFAPVREDAFVAEGGGAVAAGDFGFKVVISGPICRPLSARDYSRKWLEMEGKSGCELARVGRFFLRRAPSARRLRG